MGHGRSRVETSRAPLAARWSASSISSLNTNRSPAASTLAPLTRRTDQNPLSRLPPTALPSLSRSQSREIASVILRVPLLELARIGSLHFILVGSPND